MSKESQTFDFIGEESSENTQTENLIQNDRQLDISYVPERVLYREEQRKNIKSKVYKAAYTNGTIEHLLVVGPPGTGKTLTVRWLNQQFRHENDDDSMQTKYVNCEGNSSEKAVFEKILNTFDLDYKPGVGLGDNVLKLYSYLSENNIHLIVILDEIDALQKAHRNYINDVLYKITRPNEAFDGLDYNVKISSICISNDLSIRETFNSSVISSFGESKVKFNEYDQLQIADILMERQKKAFKKSILDEKAMKELAKYIEENFEGDIRSGIRVLKRIAEKYDPEFGDLSRKEMNELIMESVTDAKKAELEDVILQGDNHLLLVLWAYIKTANSGEMAFSQILDTYKKTCEYASMSKSGGNGAHKSKSFVRRQLESLVEKRILDKSIRYDEKRNPSYYTPSVSLEILEEVAREWMDDEGLFNRIEFGRSRLEEKRNNEAEELLDQRLSTSEEQNDPAVS